MNRKKKIYQKLKKQMQQAKAKRQPVKKPPYISKAERAALALAEASAESNDAPLNEPTSES
ncbi:DUF2986 domain-containing protein [Thiomicrospira sp.]|uniref:DUF2986 domain-containing protein n=1 Tax=Thiomicrospira sp. TaxID=935 RepID=UPI002F92F902